MQIKEGLEIKNYKDFQKNKVEIFNIISDTVDLIIKETATKNPTFLIPNYNNMVDIQDLRV